MINLFIVAGHFVEFKDNCMVLEIPEGNFLFPIPVSFEVIKTFSSLEPGDYVAVKGSFTKGEPYGIDAVAITFKKENN